MDGAASRSLPKRTLSQLRELTVTNLGPQIRQCSAIQELGSERAMIVILDLRFLNTSVQE